MMVKRRGFIKIKFDRTKEWVEKNERHLSVGALVLGFIFDWFTLNRIDQLYDNLVLLFYIFVAALAIFIVHLDESRALGSAERSGNRLPRLVSFLGAWAPAVMQFTFGGLFSGFFIFYSRSASLWTSWPYVLALLAMLIGNEFFRKHYVRQTIHIGILYFAIFSYAIFSVPMVLRKMGDGIFLLSGFISLVTIWLFFRLLRKTAPVRFKRNKKGVISSVISVLLLVNILYFTNILPPIPLSLKDAGVYHYVVRSEEDYLATIEKKSFWEKLKPTQVFHAVSNDSAYVYSAVFAPTDLEAQIIHDWQYFDSDADKWETLTRIPFTVVGGRDGGFRGYTFKENIFPGSWRVDIETEQGQTVGRINFDIVRVGEEPEVEQIIL